MFGLAPSATEEGAKGPQKGPKSLPGLCRSRRGYAVHPKLLVWDLFNWCFYLSGDQTKIFIFPFNCKSIVGNHHLAWIFNCYFGILYSNILKGWTLKTFPISDIYFISPHYILKLSRLLITMQNVVKIRCPAQQIYNIFFLINREFDIFKYFFLHLYMVLLNVVRKTLPFSSFCTKK